MLDDPKISSDDCESRREMRLLVVDDDSTQRMLLARAARQAGHFALEAASCAHAVELLESAHFDCITLDLQLEDGDGLSVLRELGARHFAGTIIVVSGMGTVFRAEARTYARSLGIAVKSMPKPVDLSALRVCLADLRQNAMGLPTVHFWGGVATDAIVGRYRHGPSPAEIR